jgi:hypothetical protein
MVMWQAMNQAAPAPNRYTTDVRDSHHTEHSPGGRGVRPLLSTLWLL